MVIVPTRRASRRRIHIGQAVANCCMCGPSENPDHKGRENEIPCMKRIPRKTKTVRDPALAGQPANRRQPDNTHPSARKNTGYPTNTSHNTEAFAGLGQPWRSAISGHSCHPICQ